MIPERRHAPELLDEGAGSLEDVQQSLHDLERLNRYLGGTRALTTHLYPRLQTLFTHATILDIGTGDASLLKTIRAWSRRQSQPCTLIGLDLMPRHLHLARPTAVLDNVDLLQAQALELPFADKSVDYVVCSLLMHHLTTDDVITLLREAYRCARYGIIMSDLVRGWLPYVGYKLIEPLFGLHPFTRHDGEVSILRGLTPAELRDCARQAGLSHAQVHQHPMFRMTLVADR